MQVAVLTWFNAQLAQVYFGGTFLHESILIIARTVAWTFKSEITFFNGTAQVTAYKANCSQTFFIMNDNGRNVGKDRPGSLPPTAI
jgi:hypothetical protein